MQASHCTHCTSPHMLVARLKLSALHAHLTTKPFLLPLLLALKFPSLHLQSAPYCSLGNGTGWGNPGRLQVRVRNLLPASFKMSSYTSKMDENWLRYSQNTCFEAISTISHPFWVYKGSF